MKLIKHASTVSSFIFVSRILGFIRDIFIAQILGVGAIADAFFVAFKFPNLFRRLFAEGALSAAFIPIFQKEIHQNTQESAQYFVNQVFSILVFFLLPFIVVVQLFMPWVLPLIAPGFIGDPEKYDLAVGFARICFPYLLFMALLALITSILNSFDRFVAGASAPILLNVFLILSLFILSPFVPNVGYALSWGVLASGLAKFLWVFVALKSYKKIKISFSYVKITAPVKSFFRLLGPGIMGAGITQINILVGTIFATLLPGGVSYLYYADRLNQLPLALIGIAMGMVLLPTLGNYYRQGKIQEALQVQNEAIFVSLLLTIPATFAFFILALPIIQTLFEGGAFTVFDTKATASTLMAYAIGLPAYILIKILMPSFFARGDTKTPMMIAFFSMVINIILIPNFMALLDYVGIAMATALSAWFHLFFLMLAAYKRNFFTWDKDLTQKTLKLVCASIIMAIGVYVVQYSLWEDEMKKIWQASYLIFFVILGMLVYSVSLLIMGISKNKMIKLFRKSL